MVFPVAGFMRQAIRTCIALCAACFAHSTFAVVFDFNDIADGAGNATVQSKLQAVLNSQAPGMTVTVMGAVGEANYTGDNHVVGPMNGNNVATPLTLGNTDLGVQHALPWDSYLVNSTANGNDRITMVFNRPIYAVSFDFEIFPDATCPDGGVTGCTNTSAANWPDFTFRADGAQVFYIDGIDPSNIGVPVVPAGVSVVAPNSTLRESPVSDGVAGYELAPQLLALSGDWYFKNGVTKLEFVDWPRLIGIDNLALTTVPEPGTFALLGVGLFGLRAFRGRRS
jgi:hypothetical protein